MQEFYWVVEIDGFEDTKSRKIWNDSSAKSVFKKGNELTRRETKLFYVNEKGEKTLIETLPKLPVL